MRASALKLKTLFLGLALVVAPTCGGDDDPGPGNQGGSGGSGGRAGMAGGAGGAGGMAGGTAGMAGGAGGGMDAGADTVAAVTWTNDVMPIFEAKCSTCHTSTRIIHNLGAKYDDAKEPVTNVAKCGAAETVGACTIVRIKAGEMPMGKMCTGDPAMDTDNEACLTAAEQATVQAWIDGGLQE